jgi:sigma-B regulation protein RsbQ
MLPTTGATLCLATWKRAAVLAAAGAIAFLCAGNAAVAKASKAPARIKTGPGTFAAGDGTPIAYEVRGRGEPTVVFIHCWACDRSYWHYQVDDLSRDHSVLALDLAGHGISGKSRKVWSIDGLGADVAGLVTGLGLKDVVLVGHSMGGPVALAAAGRLHGRVRGVVCADTLHNAETMPTRAMIDPMVASLERDFPGAMQQMVQSMFPPDSDQALAQDIIRKASAAERGPLIALLRDFANFDSREALMNAGVPVRCINASARPPVTPPTAVDINRRYADFDAVLMQDVSHYLMLERPQEFNENLRWVLKDFPAPKD